MQQNKRPYVLWRRVSTKQQGESKLGLQAQTAIALHFMEAEPVKTFTDVYSGTKLKECKALQTAIDYCKVTGCLLVVAKTDRFRNTKDGLDILDEIGEHNLSFCDLPYPDRTILTMMFAMWERQAIMGRINTKLALNVRKEYHRNGQTWISKAGNECDHLGREKGCDTSTARAASIETKKRRAIEWRENNVGYNAVRRWVYAGQPDEWILEEFHQQHKAQPEAYCTPKGGDLSLPTLKKWRREFKLVK